MAYLVDTRVVVSGRSVEVYKYHRPFYRDYKVPKFNNIQYFEQLDLEDVLEKKELYKKQAHNRAKTCIRRIVNSNPHWTKFFTLTFAENRTDRVSANYDFNLFIRRLKYRYPSFSYLAVPERQKRGAIHYHLICNMPFVNFDELREIWGFGRLEVKDIRSVKKTGAYIAKYLTKDTSDFFSKRYFCSADVYRSVELIGWYAEKFILKFCLLITPIFQKQFYSEQKGLVDYTEYSLDNSPFPTGRYDRSVLAGSP